MRIKICRFNVLQGQYEKNYQKIKTMVEQVKKDAVEVVVFQSNCIAGVHLGTKAYNEKVLQEIESYNDQIQKLAKGIMIIWGNIYQKQQAICIAKDEMFSFIGKMNQDDLLYADSKYFMNGVHTKTFEFYNEKITIGFGRKSNGQHLHLLFDQNHVQDEIQIENGYYINHFGCENVNKHVFVYDGNVAFYQDGKCLFENNAYTETIFDETSQTYRSHLLDKIIFGLQMFNRAVFHQQMKWVIGLSGGLDSSVSAVLTTMAFGKENVIGYNMASQHNSSATKSIAKTIASNLGITLKEGSIMPLVEATNEVLANYGYLTLSDLTKQNIQARIRGHLLSSFAANENAVIMNNGNKVETALGYATLYGDLIGAFSVLADLTKQQLFELVHEMNRRFNKEMIPTALIPVWKNGEMIWKQKPSAELKDHQFDPMKWFYHDYIIENLNVNFTIHEFLTMYIEKRIPLEIQNWMDYYGVLEPKAFIEDLEWLLKTMQRNSFKLLQAPPILVLSKHPFSIDQYVIQTSFEDNQYQLLKNKILN